MGVMLEETEGDSLSEGFPRPVLSGEQRVPVSTAEREPRAAQNQLLFRSVNERVKELGDRALNSLAEIDFACECDDQTCFAPITLPLEEFAGIDAAENQFIVLPGHEDPDVDDVIDRRDGYLVVAKRGAGAELVRRHR